MKEARKRGPRPKPTKVVWLRQTLSATNAMLAHCERDRELMDLTIGSARLRDLKASLEALRAYLIAEMKLNAREGRQPSEAELNRRARL